MKTFLPQNQFITNSEMHTSESAVAQQAPPIASATAAPISVSEGVKSALYPCRGESEPSVMLASAPSGTAVTDSAAGGPVTVERIPEPSMTMEVPQRAPAGLAPNTAAPAGAHWEGPWWLVLAEVLEFPPIELTDEVPLFIRDGDHLRRWEA